MKDSAWSAAIIPTPLPKGMAEKQTCNHQMWTHKKTANTSIPSLLLKTSKTYTKPLDTKTAVWPNTRNTFKHVLSDSSMRGVAFVIETWFGEGFHLFCYLLWSCKGSFPLEINVNKCNSVV